MGIEFELKFLATPQQQEAVRAAFSGPEQHYRMQTTYYDTPSGAMSARMYTLRRRIENDSSVCTLKTPVGDISRREYEVNSPTIEAALPALCSLSGIPELPELFREGLVPVCGAAFNRIAKTVCLQNCTVELALDEGILTGGGKEIPLCEIEVELKEGDRNTAVAFATQLSIAYGLKQERKSKFARAQALAKGE